MRITGRQVSAGTTGVQALARSGRLLWYRLPLVGAISLFAIGCKSGGSATERVPVRDGLYDFVARTGSYDLRGKLLWASGEASIDSEIGYCRTDPMNTDTQTIRYQCESGSDLRGLVYIIDRNFPLNRSRWRASVAQTRQRQVCARYETRNNRQVCVQWRTETYEVSVPVGGLLTFTRRQI